MIRNAPHNSRRSLQNGLTLVEMLVVIAIVMIVAAILLFKYADFSSNISIRGLAQQVALSIRKGQTYATSARIADTGTFSTDTFPAYGLTFSTDEENSSLKNNNLPSSKRFILFADIANGSGGGNRVYDNGTQCGTPTQGDECVEAFTITSSDKVSALCVDSDVTNCVPPSDGTATIFFHRPVPDAQICTKSSGNNCIAPASYITIVLQSIKGVEKYITVWNTGQISVK